MNNQNALGSAAKKIVFEHDLPAFAARIDYVLRFLESHPLLIDQIVFTTASSSATDLRIYYGPTAKADTVFVPAQQLIFQENFNDTISICPNSYSFDSYTLYSVERERKSGQPFFQDHHYTMDWIEMIFFHISRLEEYLCPAHQKNSWGAHPPDAQFLVRHDLSQMPVIDHLVYCLGCSFGLTLSPSRTQYHISHDIDAVTLQPSLLQKSRATLGVLWRGQSLGAISRIWASVRGENPYDIFDWMLREQQDRQRSIYWLVGGQTKYDSPFDFASPVVQRALKWGRERGYTMGLHPSYATWQDQTTMEAEKHRFEQLVGTPVRATRQHYLHFSWPETPRILENLGFETDSSLGFTDRIGFRCGTGFGYQLYNFERERPFAFTEVPLVWMDSALLRAVNYQPAAFRTAWDQFLKDNSHLTQITFNFHNTRFYDAWLHDIPLREYFDALWA